MAENSKQKIFRPNIDTLAKNEELTYDSKAYKALHRLNTEFPALSFDIFPEKSAQKNFPFDINLVSGSQAPKGKDNRISLLRISGLEKTKYDLNSDYDSEISDNSEDILKSVFDEMHNEKKEKKEPNIDIQNFNYRFGDINRIKIMNQSPEILATSSSDSNIYIWKISEKYNKKIITDMKNIARIENHEKEGFSLCWSPLKKGLLLSGDTNGAIFSSYIKNDGVLKTSDCQIAGHSESVEDIQCSPVEKNVFASCSVDKSIRLWDLRLDGSKPPLEVQKAHFKDVNVISWNSKNEKLLASGSDDNSFKVWDLRCLRQNNAIAFFKWHKMPITSIEWSPFDETVLVVSSEDNTITTWDLSLEEEFTKKNEGPILSQKLPPQLMFVHMGQNEIKEVRFHPQIKNMIISTSLEGFNMFIPDNI